MFPIFFRTASLIVLGSGIFASPTVAQWPQWRGPNRDGFAPAGPLLASLPQQGLTARWVVKDIQGGNSGGWGSPVIDDHRVFVFVHSKTRNDAVELGPPQYPYLAPEKRTMSDEEFEQYEINRRIENEQRARAFRFDQRMLCLDLDTGKLLWEHTQDSAYTRFTHSGTPCVVGDHVLVLAPGRLACCWDKHSGKLLWSVTLPGEFRDEHFSSSFVSDGQTAVVACGPVFALNLADGALLWQGDANHDYASHASPVLWQTIAGTAVIANTRGGKTVARRLSDGQLLWQLDSGTGQSSPVVIDQQLLTFGSSRKSGLTAYRLNPTQWQETPVVDWRFQRAADQGCTPAVAHGAVFVQGDRRLSKVDLQTGKAIWQELLPVSSPRYTSPIVVGDQVLFAWQGVVVVDAMASNFRLIYDAKMTADGRLVEAQLLRKELDLTTTDGEGSDLAEAERIWQREAIRTSTLDCSTPAAAGGVVIFRLRDGLFCVDLHAG